MQGEDGSAWLRACSHLQVSLPGAVRSPPGEITMQRLLLATGMCCVLSAALVGADDKKDANKKAADKKWILIDLQLQANQKLKENFHYECPNAPNSLGALPMGEQTLA